MVETETTDPNTMESKVASSRDAVTKTISYIERNAPAYRPRSSPIAALLRSDADRIRKAMDAGWTAGAIARMLHAEGMKFSEDAIRLRIGKMFAKSGSSAEKPRRERTASGAGSVRPSRDQIKVEAPPQRATAPSAATHAGFDEDPR